MNSYIVKYESTEGLVMSVRVKATDKMSAMESVKKERNDIKYFVKVAEL